MTTKLSFSELLKRAQKFEKIAIHTANEEQAKTLLTELDEIGYRWANGEKLTDITYYEVEKEITCYNFEPNKKIMYSPLDYYQKNNYTIIEFSDIDFKE